MPEHTSIEIFKYEVPEGVCEYHAILRVTNPLLTYAEQVECLLGAYGRLLEGELKYFYSNYKDYFYLPMEDMAYPGRILDPSTHEQ